DLISVGDSPDFAVRLSVEVAGEEETGGGSCNCFCEGDTGKGTSCSLCTCPVSCSIS
ncbi:ORF1A, partial [Turkey adenovirus 1]